MSQDCGILVEKESGDRVHVKQLEPLTIEDAFWTSGQRQSLNLHEVSYRACFKPELPRYFIDRFSHVDEVVYDPFAGRGTTIIEAALAGRRVIANDVNPLSTLFTRARLAPPSQTEVDSRLSQIRFDPNLKSELDLTMFYERDTLNEILGLRAYFRQRRDEGSFDNVDEWLQMVATNRLTGHSPGFFSVYSFPPNQAVSAASQIRINQKRGQAPTYRDTRALIAKKSKQLLRGLEQPSVRALWSAGSSALYSNLDAALTPQIEDSSVHLTVTSPPFLDVVNYAEDNWLRGWFNQIDMSAVSTKITMSKTVEQWSQKMGAVLCELHRVTKPGGVVAFEVGEVRKGKIRLEEAIQPLGVQAGFEVDRVMINTQQFTKTANIWGVRNNSSGTNSNRIVLFRK
jgi:DNA modification methylase